MGAMVASLLSRAGQALYGRRWIPQLSEAVGFINGEVRAMNAGRRPIPPEVWRDLRRLIRVRQRELSEIQREIRGLFSSLALSIAAIPADAPWLAEAGWLVG